MQIYVDDKEVRKTLATLAAQMKSLRPVMSEIGEIIRTSVERNFRAQGRPKKWKSSARVKKEGGQTLSLTGRLRRSLTVRADNDQVAIGTNVKYAAIHQFGGKTKPRTIVAQKAKALYWPGAAHPVRAVRHPGANMPARPFLMVQDEDWEEIRYAVNSYLLKGR